MLRFCVMQRMLPSPPRMHKQKASRQALTPQRHCPRPRPSRADHLALHLPRQPPCCKHSNPRNNLRQHLPAQPKRLSLPVHSSKSSHSTLTHLPARLERSLRLRVLRNKGLHDRKQNQRQSPLRHLRLQGSGAVPRALEI